MLDYDKQPQEEVKIVCPVCKGTPSGPRVVFHNTGEDYTKHYQTVDDSPCDFCKGKNYVTWQEAHRYNEGRRMRQERLDRSESLREAANRMGISAVELSAIERGRQPITPTSENRCGACQRGQHADCSGWCFCDCTVTPTTHTESDKEGET